jgi:hypothetical protein
MSGTQENYTKVILLGLFITITGGIIVVNYEHRTFDDKKEVQSESPPVNQSMNSGALPLNSENTQSSGQYSGTSTQPKSQYYHPESKTSKPKAVDYTSYINTSLNKSNVSVIIVDANGNLSTSASSAIAYIYRKTGKSTSMGLIRSAFIKKPEFQELWEGNSDVIKKLKLKDYTDYLALGRINYSMRSGTLVSGTIICSASISMSIISTNGKSIAQSFTISNANGNGATKSQAQENALQKLLDKYYNEHSSL